LDKGVKIEWSATALADLDRFANFFRPIFSSSAECRITPADNRSPQSI